MATSSSKPGASFAAKKTSTKTAAPEQPFAVVAAKAALASKVAPAAKAAAVTKPKAKGGDKKSATVESNNSQAPAAGMPTISQEQRRHYVSVAAFYIAQRRGFAAGSPLQDWLAAEAEIDRLIASGHFST